MSSAVMMLMAQLRTFHSSTTKWTSTKSTVDPVTASAAMNPSKEKWITAQDDGVRLKCIALEMMRAVKVTPTIIISWRWKNETSQDRWHPTSGELKSQTLMAYDETQFPCRCSMTILLMLFAVYTWRRANPRTRIWVAAKKAWIISRWVFCFGDCFHKLPQNFLENDSLKKKMFANWDCLWWFIFFIILVIHLMSFGVNIDIIR